LNVEEDSATTIFPPPHDFSKLELAAPQAKTPRFNEFL